MSSRQVSSRRFTLAPLLFACTSQLYCGPTEQMPPVSQSVLDVHLIGADYGTVTSAPAGIDCGASCKVAYDSGTSVTLTAAAKTNATFLGWGGSCQSSGKAATCTVSLQAATVVTAQFMRNGIPLKVSKSGDGSGQVTSQSGGIACGAQCENGFDLGTRVTIAATPDAGSQFVGWSGACSGTASTCQVTMDAAKQVTAQFHSPPPAVIGIAPYLVDKGGGMVVTIIGSGFQPGSQVTIGGVPATSVRYTSATELQVMVPARTQAGCAAVVVQNPLGQRVSLAHALAYQPTAVSFGSAVATSALSPSPVVVRAADLDRDGKMDLLVASASGSVQSLRGNGDGTFGAAQDVFADLAFSGLELVDLNQDGKLDALAVSSVNSKLFVLMGSGDGKFSKTNEYATGATPQALALGDTNADGKIDALTANLGDTNVSVLLGNGDGSFSAKVDYAVGAPVQAVKLADVNNDRYADIVAAASDGNVYFLFGKGDGTFLDAVNVGIEGNLKDLAIADLDADGHLDLATTDFAGTDVKVRLGDGAISYVNSPGTFSLGQAGALSTYPNMVGFWDVNLDGKLDVVASSDESGLSYFLNQGATFATRADLAVGVKPQSIGFEDLNGDCLPDFVTVNQGDGTASVLLNTSH